MKHNKHILSTQPKSMISSCIIMFRAIVDIGVMEIAIGVGRMDALFLKDGFGRKVYIALFAFQLCQMLNMTGDYSYQVNSHHLPF